MLAAILLVPRSMHPGRGQILAFWRQIDGRGAETVKLSVERGLPFELHADPVPMQDSVFFEPPRFTAPGEVTEDVVASNFEALLIGATTRR